MLDARERVLGAAERLFAERGYTAVTVKDIAQAAGIHHASLYHHVPQGKAQLFVEVTERTIRLHQRGISDAIAAGGSVRDQLSAIAAWMLAQPPMDMIRLVHSDVPALESAQGAHLLSYAFNAILEPIEGILRRAQGRGEIGQVDLGNAAGGVFAMIQGLHMLPAAYRHRPRPALADELIDLLLAGMRAAA